MAAENNEQTGVFRRAEGFIASVYNAVMSGGQIEAAFYQGVSELGQALKAFPDSIQAIEPGTVFNPFYSDREHAYDPKPDMKMGIEPLKQNELMSPGELARGNAGGTVHGETQREAAKEPLPSAGEVANDQQPHRPDQDKGQEHGHDQGRSL